ncbi:MAG: hypothetical protein ACR2OB_07025 [Solirubrobacteraceae bacterium]
MTLGRAWMRQLFGASGAALLVPGSVVAALFVLAFAGGFGRLSTLGQVFSGPAVVGAPGAVSHRPATGLGLPAAATSGAGSTAGLGAGVTSGAGAARSAAGATGTSGVGARSTGGRVIAGGTGGLGAPGGSGGTGGSRGSGSHGSQGGFAPGQPGPAPGAAPPVAPLSGAPPTLVDDVIKIGTSVTGAVPGVVGALGTQTLDALGAVVDRFLPLRLGGVLASDPPAGAAPTSNPPPGGASAPNPGGGQAR